MSFVVRITTSVFDSKLTNSAIFRISPADVTAAEDRIKGKTGQDRDQCFIKLFSQGGGVILKRQQT